MAEIRPFRGVRFSSEAGKPGELLCPPYDIISEEQRRGYIKANERNIIRIELPEGGDERYERAGRLLSEWLNEGALRRDEKENLYIYGMDFDDAGKRKSIRGIFCLVKLAEFSEGVVLPHEETLPKAKSDRLSLIKATNANISPIFSLFRDEERVTDGILDGVCAAAPDTELTDEAGVTHRLWITSDADVIAALRGELADKKLYIADGHHRYETALEYRRQTREKGGAGADYVMMVIMSMDSPDLTVYPTHRIITPEGAFEPGRALDTCGSHFDIVRFGGDFGAAQAKEWLDEELAGGFTSFVMYWKGGGAGLRLNDADAMKKLLPDKSDAYRSLDVSVLHSLVLERAFGIGARELAGQKGVRYSRDANECLTEVDAGNAACAFLISATRVDEIADVAAAGEKMPQKSTYFYPKLITGLVINVMEI